MQRTLDELQTVNPTGEVKEVWRCTASQNVDDHAVLCSIDEIVVGSVTNAIRNDSPLADWQEYNTELQ